MDKETFDKLIDQVNNGTATDEQLSVYNAYMNRLSKPDTAWANLGIEESAGQVQTELWQMVKAGMAPATPIRQIKPWYRVAAAAAILLALSVGGYWLTRNKAIPKNDLAQQHDLAPGGNKAILTLANGQKIVLNDSKTGIIAKQGSAIINKTTEGEVVYQHKQDDNQQTQAALNLISTPRGGQYHVVLADGSQVWLNAASSIKYPTLFNGNTREVEITGEVYFEVAHQANKPFKVHCNGQVVTVLGTHFNINAYTNEGAIKTTLLQGSVMVSTGKQQVTLKPGQQANNVTNGLTKIENADVDLAIAWHKGLFQFKDADVPTLMRQLSRWYDVDIDYEGSIPDAHFSGKIQRNYGGLKVSNILSYANIHFKIQDHKIIVLP